MTKEQDDYFNKGFALAITMITRESGDYSLAERILNDTGIPFKDFKKSEIDEFDMRELKKIYKADK